MLTEPQRLELIAEVRIALAAGRSSTGIVHDFVASGFSRDDVEGVLRVAQQFEIEPNGHIAETTGQEIFAGVGFLIVGVGLFVAAVPLDLYPLNIGGAMAVMAAVGIFVRAWRNRKR